MKKLLAIIGIITALSCVTAPLAMARVDLPSDLRPEFSPYIDLNKNAPDANEADYATFFLQLIAGGLLYLAGPVAILVIAVSGLRYVTAHGKQETLDGAKKTLMYAIIGLVVVIMSFAMVRLVITTIYQTDQNAAVNQAIPAVPDTRD